MTLAQFVQTVRRRHNAVGDDNWSDAEIYELLTHRLNMALTYIGMLEATDTSNTSTDGTQAINFPTDAVTIRDVLYLGDRLKKITFEEWERYRDDVASDYTTSGTPTMYAIWNRQILLVPVPANTGDQITIYYYKEHTYIDGSTQTTIDIPSVLHAHLVPGVLSDMYAKDLNVQLMTFYEGQWLNTSIPAFQRFKANEEAGSNFNVLGDSDTQGMTGVW